MGKGKNFHKRVERIASNRDGLVVSNVLSINPGEIYNVHGNILQEEASSIYFKGKGYCLSRAGLTAQIIGAFESELWFYEGPVADLYLSASRGFAGIDLGYEVSLLSRGDPRRKPFLSNLKRAGLVERNPSQVALV